MTESEDLNNVDEKSCTEIIALVNELKQKQWMHYNKYKELEITIRDIKYILYNKCRHQWNFDYSYANMYDGSEEICEICGLFKDIRCYLPYKN